MLNFEHIYTAGTHKVAELHVDAKRRAALAELTDERRPQRNATLLQTLRLLAS